MPTTTDPLIPWEATFREQMERRRHLIGMTQTELAARLKDRGFSFHQQTVQKIEIGERSIRLNEAFAIAEALDATLATFVATGIAPNERDARWAVDRFRKAAGNVEDDLEGVADDWLQAFEDLGAVFLAALKEHELAEGASHVLVWLGAWATKAVRAWRGLQEVIFFYISAGGEDHDFGAYAGEPESVKDVVEGLAKLSEILKGEDSPLDLEDLTYSFPDELYSTLTGESPRERMKSVTRPDADEFSALSDAFRPVTEQENL